jgi:hypothetical protein
VQRNAVTGGEISRFLTQVRGWRSVPLACRCDWQASYFRLPSTWTLKRRSRDCPVHTVPDAGEAGSPGLPAGAPTAETALLGKTA